MAEFLNIVFTFPTVVFTVLLSLSFFTLILSVIGGLGADTFDLDVDLDADDAGLSLFQILSSFGIGKVPMSFFAAAYTFSGWVISLFVTGMLAGAMDINIVVGMGVLVLSALAAFPLSALLLTPLAALMESDEGATTGDGLIGEVCTISSGRVDTTFGRARCYVDQTELTLSVRCPHDNELSRGDEVLIIDFVDADNTYVVESVDAIMQDDVPDDIADEDTILDDIDFEQLEETTQRHREEKQKVEQGDVHTVD